MSEETTGHGNKTRLRAAAIEALLTEPTAAAAAAKVGIAAKTLSRWQADPAFAAALAEAKRAVVAGAVTQYRRLFSKTPVVLARLLADANTPPATLLAVCRTIWEVVHQADVLADIEDRLTLLEQGRGGRP